MGKNRRKQALPTPHIRQSRFVELNTLPLSLRIGSYTAQFLYWGFFSRRWWRNYLHTHSFFEICHAYAGRGKFHTMGTDHTVGAGDIFVAKPSEPHEIVSSRSDPLGIYFWSYTLVPDASRRREPSPRADATDALLEAFAASRTWVKRSPAGMQPTLELLTDEIVQRKPGFSQAVESLATKLLLDTARAVVEQPIVAEAIEKPTQNASEAAVRTAVRYLRDNFNRPITVDDVAEQVHLSRRHIARLFRQATKVPMMQYLTDLRVQTAAQLLSSGELPIKRIALDCGYPDVHYFTTLFRKHTGLTPAAFRDTRGTRWTGRQ